MRPRPVTAPVSIPRTDWSGHRAAGLRTAGQRTAGQRTAGQRPAGQRPGQRQRPVTGHRSAGQPIGRTPAGQRTAGQRPVTGHPPVIHWARAYGRGAYIRSRSWSPTGHPRRRDSLMNEYDSDGESAEVLSTTFQTSSCW